MRQIVLAIAMLCAPCWATQYYVSSSTGNDVSGAGTQANPWQTLSGPSNHINGGSFQPGDVIYLRRGDTWNEQLIPPSSGTSGSPITFDAYGTGPAPVITAMAAINGGFAAATWTHVSGNVWATSATPGVNTAMGGATTVDMVQFGSVWGRHQPYGSGCTTSITGKYDWCIVYPKVYVYAPSATTPATYYSADGSITPYVDSATGLPLISVASKTWIVFQHIKLQGFSYMGVSVSGNSDNLIFANMESDGLLPYGATPHGFYVNVNSGYGTNIQFLNDEVRMHDYGWGTSNDRNLLGRFSAQTFSLARLARTQNYFLRLYDSSTPPRYSRYAAALHVDYPL